MVQRRVIHDGEHGPAGSRLGIARGEDQPADPSVQDGSGAHRAGLEGADEGAAQEAVVAQQAPGRAQGHNLCMSRRVVCAQNLVVAPPEHLTGGRDHEGANGNLARGFRGPGLGQGESHQGFVAEHGGHIPRT